MNLRELAQKCIKEGFEKGGKLIEMGEFDPMYPEVPDAGIEQPVSSSVSVDTELLRELLLWAGADDQAADNVVLKAEQLSATGPLTVDHLMDLTGAADYEQPGCNTNQAPPSGIVSPVVPSGPMSPVMASYQRRAKAILEGVSSPETLSTKRNKGNHGLNVKKIKEIIASIDENDEDGLYKALDQIQDPESSLYGNIKSPYAASSEDDINQVDANETMSGKMMAPKFEDEEEIEPEMMGSEIEDVDASIDDVEGDVEGDVDDVEDEVGSTSQAEIADEIGDIDFAADTIEGAVDGAAEAVSDAAPGALDDVDPSILDGDNDGETVKQQIAQVKDKIDSIAAELGIGIDGLEDELDDEEMGMEDELDDEDELEDELDDEEMSMEDELEDELDDEDELEDELDDEEMSMEDELEDELDDEEMSMEDEDDEDELDDKDTGIEEL